MKRDQDGEPVETGQLGDSPMGQLGALEAMIGEGASERDQTRSGAASQPLREGLGEKQPLPDVPGGSKKHSAAQTKKYLPAKSRILVTVMGADGHVRPIDKFNIVDIAPSGDLEEFIRNVMVPKYGIEVDYPIWTVDDNDNKKFWTTISFAKPIKTAAQVQAQAPRSQVPEIDATRKMLDEERRAAKQEEREKFEAIQAHDKQLREDFARDIAEVRRSVIAGNRSPEEALITMRVIKQLQEESVNASDKTIQELREQIKDLKAEVDKGRDEGGGGNGRSGRGGDSGLAHMLLLTEMMSTLKQDPGVAGPPTQTQFGGGVPMGEMLPEHRQPRTTPIKEAQELLKSTFEMITPFIPQQGQGGSSQQPQVNMADIMDRMTDKFTIITKDIIAANDRRFVEMERRMDEIKHQQSQLATTTSKPASDIDSLVGAMVKLKEASGIFGGGEIGDLEFVSNIVEQAPAVIEALGDAWEKNQRARAEAGANGSVGGGGKGGGQQRQQRAPSKHQQIVEQNTEKKILTKFAIALRDAKTDTDLFNAIAFFVSKMHNHKSYGKFIRAIVVSKGSDRRSYVEQIVNHFFAGKPPDGLIDRVCKVIADNEADIQKFLAMEAQKKMPSSTPPAG